MKTNNNVITEHQRLDRYDTVTNNDIIKESGEWKKIVSQLQIANAVR